MSPLGLIRIALIVSTFIYAFIVWTVPLAHLGHSPVWPVMLIVLYVLAIPSLAIAFFFGRLANRGPERLLRPRRIVQWAMIETVTIYGMLAAFLGKDWRLFVPLWIVSLIAFALSPPYQRRIAFP